MKRLEPDILGARHAAARLIAEYGITEPAQIVLEDIAWDRGVYVRVGPIQGAEAWLVRQGKNGLIRISDCVREVGRRRFGIAHELGHWELHMGLSQAWLCTSDHIHAYRGSSAEIEANAFSGELLMPRDMLRKRMGAAGVDFQLVRALANEFNTTLTATAIRVVEETSEDCYVVLSHRGYVNWWKRGNRGSGMYLERRQAVSPDSLAWRCEYDQVDHCPMAQVPTQAWFPAVRDDDGIEVWEESLLIREYELVLTLLCIV